MDNSGTCELLWPLFGIDLNSVKEWYEFVNCLEQTWQLLFVKILTILFFDNSADSNVSEYFKRNL